MGVVRKALIRQSDGLVSNVILTDETFIAPGGYILIDVNDAPISPLYHAWDGQEFVKSQLQIEKEEQSLLDGLKPSLEEIQQAEFELRSMNLLMEVGLI